MSNMPVVKMGIAVSQPQFAHTGKALFAATKLLGVDEIDFNRPAGLPCPDENPFS